MEKAMYRSSFFTFSRTTDTLVRILGDGDSVSPVNQAIETTLHLLVPRSLRLLFVEAIRIAILHA